MSSPQPRHLLVGRETSQDREWLLVVREYVAGSKVVLTTNCNLQVLEDRRECIRRQFRLVRDLDLRYLGSFPFRWRMPGIASDPALPMPRSPIGSRRKGPQHAC